MQNNPAPSPTQVPAGWYPDHTGHTRWWDGYAWGEYASAAPATPLSSTKPSGMSIAALSLAIATIPGVLLAIFSTWLGFALLFVPAVLAIVLGAVAMSRAKKQGRADSIATAGMVIGIIAFCIGPATEILG